MLPGPIQPMELILYAAWYFGCEQAKYDLTLCGLVTPYEDIDMDLRWLRQWLVAWVHQTITPISVEYHQWMAVGIELREISQKLF